MDFYSDFSLEDEFYLNQEIVVSEITEKKDYLNPRLLGGFGDNFRNFIYYKKDQIKNIYKYPKYYDWKIICRVNPLPERFLRDFNEYLDWWGICLYQSLSEKFIYDFQDKIYWYVLSNSTLSEKLIKDFIDKVDVSLISRKQRLSKNFIIKYFDKLDLEGLIYNLYLDEETKNYIRMFV